MNNNHRYNKGFTLVEMAIALIITGMFVALILNIMEPIFNEIPRNETKERMRVIEEAIQDFTRENGFLPCPADPTAAPANQNTFGVAYCSYAAVASPPPGVIVTNTGRPDIFASPGVGNTNVLIGSLPTEDLDLPPTYMLDGWARRFKYAVTERDTSVATFNNRNGAIFVLNNEESAANVSDVTSIPGNVHFVLLSHGQEGKGSYTYDGLPSGRVCIDPRHQGVDQENCDDNDAIFAAAEIVKQMGPRFFDDLILYRAFMPGVESPTCGDQGLIYAPAHPERVLGTDCLDPSYERYDQSDPDFSNNNRIYSNPAIPNNDPAENGFGGDPDPIANPITWGYENAFTLSSTNLATSPPRSVVDGIVYDTHAGDFTIKSLNNPEAAPVIKPLVLHPGDYLLFWTASMRFNNPQPGQFALLEFNIRPFAAASPDIIKRTHTIPYQGPTCNDPAFGTAAFPSIPIASPIQNESGLIAFRVDQDLSISPNLDQTGFLGIKLRLARGTPPWVSGICPSGDPSVELVSNGAYSVFVNILRKPQTF